MWAHGAIAMIVLTFIVLYMAKDFPLDGQLDAIPTCANALLYSGGS